MLVAGLIHVLPLEQRRGINRREAADIWGVSPTFFDKLVREGQAPKPRSLHGRRIWHRHEVERAFDAWFGLDSARATIRHEAASDEPCDLDRELAAFETKHGYH